MPKNFKIDARLILQLGRDSIKDHTTALIELVKNSFDADATKVEIVIRTKDEKKIRIADNGFGMTEKEVDDNWLKIGYSEKKKKKTSTTGRRKTGEKGIGRIAADRLGANLKMVTKSESDVIQGIEVNWDEFDTDDKSIFDIELKELAEPVIIIPKKKDEPQKSTGTELTITELRNEWTDENIRSLYQELSYFSPLFDDKFEVAIDNDVNPAYSKVVQSAIYETAEIELTLHYDGSEQLIYNFKNKIIPEKNKTEIFDLKQFLSQQSFKRLSCGPIDLTLYFFVRKSDLLEGTNFSLSDLKSFLQENYGIKIYRDNVVVKPYGFANNQFGKDWLGLDVRKLKDPASLSRKKFKVNASNILGSVQISRDKNPDLKDSAAREGLVENDAFIDLKNLVNASIVLLEAYRIDINNESIKEIKYKKSSTQNYISRVRDKLGNVTLNINQFKNLLPDSNKTDKNLLEESAKAIEEVIVETEQTFEELLDEKRILNALASLGIASAVFGHETESAINIFKDAANNARGYLKKPTPSNIEIASEQLGEAIKQSKVIASWGIFALSRIEKEKRIRRQRPVHEIINKVIEQLNPAFESLNIELDVRAERIVASTFAMDIETVLLNLLTNAFNAVPNTSNKRIIKIRLIAEDRNHKKGLLLSVSDSGPGVAKEYIDKIWEPLFTTRIGSRERESGTGLGLSIIRSVVTELNGEATVTNDEDLKGAKFNIWLPKKA